MAVYVIIGLAVIAILALVVHAFFFSTPDQSDPTKAKIPEHMKRGIAYGTWDEEERKRKAWDRRRSGDAARRN
jgi:hypothetical protein